MRGWLAGCQVDVDYGSPQGLCKELTPNVFTREYTKSTWVHWFT
jgi:hypothetical protein